MKNKYYIILFNPETLAYIDGEIDIHGKITNRDDLQHCKEVALNKYNLLDEKYSWIVLNWKKFEVEEE